MDTTTCRVCGDFVPDGSGEWLPVGATSRVTDLYCDSCADVWHRRDDWENSGRSEFKEET